MFTLIPSTGALRRGFRLRNAPVAPPYCLAVDVARGRRFRRALHQQPRAKKPPHSQSYATVHDLTTQDGDTLAMKQQHSGRVLQGGAAGEGTHGIVRRLFDAIRHGDPHQAYEIIAAMDPAGEDADLLVALPATEFGELMQSLDPVRVHATVDALHDLRIPPAMQGQGFASDDLLDENGVRRIYPALIRTLAPVVEARVAAGAPTPPCVFTVLFRIAGAASHPELAGRIRQLGRQAAAVVSARWGHPAEANVMSEHLKLRFLTEPLYYQHDMERVRVRPRNVSYKLMRVKNQQRRELDDLRLSLRASQTHRVRMDPDRDEQDMHRRISNKRLARVSMPLSRLEGAGLTEDLVCTALVASTRTGSSHLARLMLRSFYGVETNIQKQTGIVHLKGGQDLAPGSPRTPTPKLLLAIARALGTNCEVDLALQLITYFSRRYDVAVPSEVWSEWLRWCYVHGAKPASREWQIVGDERRIRAPREMVGVVHALESGQLAFEFHPGFYDLVAVAGALIDSQRLPQALEKMRAARAVYGALGRRHERAAVGAAAAAAQGVPLSRRASARTSASLVRMAAERDVMRFELTKLCRAFLKAAGRVSRYRSHLVVSSTRVPDFVAEFWDLLPQTVSYNTLSGHVWLRGTGQWMDLRREWLRSPDTRLGIRVKGWAEVPDEGGIGRWRGETILVRHSAERTVRTTPSGGDHRGETEMLRQREWDVGARAVLVDGDGVLRLAERGREWYSNKRRRLGPDPEEM